MTPLSLNFHLHDCCHFACFCAFPFTVTGCGFIFVKKKKNIWLKKTHDYSVNTAALQIGRGFLSVASSSKARQGIKGLSKADSQPPAGVWGEFSRDWGRTLCRVRFNRPVVTRCDRNLLSLCKGVQLGLLHEISFRNFIHTI